MGQGANSSLEDGVCVGRIIGAPVAQGAQLSSSLAAFDRARKPRCQQIARRSLLTARIGAHVGNGWSRSLRNPILRRVPAGPAAKAAAEILRWTPPEQAPLDNDPSHS